jgi:hypothetical protein
MFHLTFLANIRPEWKGQSGTNDLAYLDSYKRQRKEFKNIDTRSEHYKTFNNSSLMLQTNKLEYFSTNKLFQTNIIFAA